MKKVVYIVQRTITTQNFRFPH